MKELDDGKKGDKRCINLFKAIAFESRETFLSWHSPTPFLSCLWRRRPETLMPSLNRRRQRQHQCFRVAPDDIDDKRHYTVIQKICHNFCVEMVPINMEWFICQITRRSTLLSSYLKLRWQPSYSQQSNGFRFHKRNSGCPHCLELAMCKVQTLLSSTWGERKM